MVFVESSKPRNTILRDFNLIFYLQINISKSLLIYFFQFMTANHTGCDDKEKLVEFGQHRKLEIQLAWAKWCPPGKVSWEANLWKKRTIPNHTSRYLIGICDALSIHEVTCWFSSYYSRWQQLKMLSLNGTRVWLILTSWVSIFSTFFLFPKLLKH